jgi:hypothetical protein
MSKIKKSLMVLSVCLWTSSCSTAIDDYQNKTGQFDLKEYFNGPLIAWGTIQNINDKVTRRFCVELAGTWEGNRGILAEKFFYDDGEISYRNWALTKQENGHYQGTADDVIGIAQGQHQGFAFQLQYTLVLPVGDSVYNVSMNDWMYQIDEHRVMNKTSISKFGVNVANVTLFFDKQTVIKSCEVPR